MRGYGIIEILKGAGAIRTGHFVGVSGRHMPTYITKDAWLPQTRTVSTVCRLLADAHHDRHYDAVVGPAIGGIILSQWTAHHLSSLVGRQVLSIFTEKTSDNGQVLKRGYDRMIEGKRVLVVEDTVTTGGSIVRTIDAVRKAGAEVVGVSAIVNRDPARVTDQLFGAPFKVLADYPQEDYAPSEVPEWLARIPVATDVGHGARYV